MRIGPRPPLQAARWRRSWLWIVPLALLPTCTTSRESVAPSERTAHHGFLRREGRLPNILLLTIDTLRSDHVAGQDASFSGLTPHLDHLAAIGCVFVHATSPAPATRPALAALMTGTYPGRHSVFSNRHRLRPDAPTLAQMLKRAGYATTALYGNAVLLPEQSGFQRGFDRYEAFVPKRGPPSDAHGTDLAIAFLDHPSARMSRTGSPERAKKEASPQPWFLWLHLMSPHGPYDSAPEPPEVTTPRIDPLPDVDLPRHSSNYGLGVLPKYQSLRRVPARASAYRERYREEVFFADAQVGRVLRLLEDRGLLSSTLLIVSADHGESLGEHDLFFQHGWLPNEASVHVPLIWSLPGAVRSGHRVAENVSLVDVLPTLAAGLGLPLPPKIEGRDLSAALAGAELKEASVFSLTAYPNQVTAIRRGDWKLIHTPAPPKPLPEDSWRDFYPREESFALFDLRTDPGELRDLRSQAPDRAASLRAELLRWERRNGIPSGSRAPPEVDPATKERLRALGYLD